MPPRIEQVHDEAVEQYFSRKSKEKKEPKKKGSVENASN